MNVRNSTKLHHVLVEHVGWITEVIYPVESSRLTLFAFPKI